MPISPLRSFCLVILLASAVSAAPPVVSSIFPSGGQRGQTVQVGVTGNAGTPPAAVWCSRPEIKIEPDKDAGKYTVQVPADAAPGVAWLRWHNAEGSSALRAFVVGTLPEVLEKEPNNELTQATAVDLPRVANGVLNKSGEVDVYAVTLKKGETLVAALDANRTLGSPMDGVLQSVSAKGFVLEQNDDGPGYDPLAVCVAPADGTYYVRVFAFPTEPNTSVALHGGPDYVYRLTLSAGPYASYSRPLALQRNVATPVRLSGWNFAAPLELPVTASTGDTFIIQHDALTNTLSVPVVEHPSLLEAEPATAAAPMKIAVPTTVTGVIGMPRERDVYSFTATKGQRIVFNSDARPIGSLLDPFLAITDASGKTLVENDDTPKSLPDAEITWAAPADGEYRVMIRDLYDDGGPRYFYRLTVELEREMFALTVAADQFTLPKDKPLEIPVTVERTGGFGHEIDITLAGLPEGLNCAAVKSMPTGDSSKAVKLVIERKTGDAAKALPDGAMIRIVGETSKPQPFTRTAAGPMAGRKTTTSDLWLTIVPPG
ncbi:MAG: PPC domain-containing protein [Planctomycetaceae bacterium]|nr:PPC domain-containing protein [Planctomycetaceae bacterium]